MKELKNISISELVVNNGQIEGVPKNPRFIRDERYEKLKQSISDSPEMLDYRRLAVYPYDGKYVVLCGNMRLRACKELGYKEMPCYVLSDKLDSAKLREWIIKDNEAFGQNDWDILANEWDADELTDWGMETPADWGMQTQTDDDGQGEVEEDDFDESAPVENRCKQGEIWKLGEHRLMCGDSTKKEDVERLMGGQLADLWLTDPPYNVSYEGGTKDKLTIQNDSMKDDEFLHFLTEAFSASEAVLKEGGVYYIWHADSEGYNFRYALKTCGFKLRQTLIWNKNSMVLGRQDYQWKHEPCLYGWKDGAGHKWYGDRSQTTVIDFNKPTRNGEHPTMKPVGLFAYQIQNSSKKGDIVLDTFGGRGTSIIASEQTGRRCYTMELDPHYCDVIIARWEKLTGKTAEKIE